MTYNAQNQQTEWALDGVWLNDGTVVAVQDGTPNLIARTAWVDDNVVSVHIDADNDGTDDVILLQEWDASSRMTRVAVDGYFEGRELLNQADGVLDVEVDLTWYDDGQLRSQHTRNSGQVFMIQTTRDACSTFD